MNPRSKLVRKIPGLLSGYRSTLQMLTQRSKQILYSLISSQRRIPTTADIRKYVFLYVIKGCRNVTLGENRLKWVHIVNVVLKDSNK